MGPPALRSRPAGPRQPAVHQASSPRPRLAIRSCHESDHPASSSSSSSSSSWDRPAPHGVASTTRILHARLRNARVHHAGQQVADQLVGMPVLDRLPDGAGLDFRTAEPFRIEAWPFCRIDGGSPAPTPTGRLRQTGARVSGGRPAPAPAPALVSQTKPPEQVGRLESGPFWRSPAASRLVPSCRSSRRTVEPASPARPDLLPGLAPVPPAGRPSGPGPYRLDFRLAPHLLEEAGPFCRDPDDPSPGRPVDRTEQAPAPHDAPTPVLPPARAGRNRAARAGGRPRILNLVAS